MNSELLDENPRGDLLQQIDDGVGDTIERVVQKWLPKDLARKVRREAVRFIGNEVKPERPEWANQAGKSNAQILRETGLIPLPRRGRDG